MTDMPDSSSHLPEMQLNTSLAAQVRNRISTLSYLPTNAAVAVKLVQLSKCQDAEPVEYSRVIMGDASLSSKLLALANSPWFGVRNRITKVHSAINLLGVQTVRTMAISYCLTGLHHALRLSPDESRLFWTSSLCKAVAARAIARHRDPSAAEEAFCCGLFQDFALPIMFVVARQTMDGFLRDRSMNIAARLVQERTLFDSDHAELAEKLATRLELPQMFIHAVAGHHRLDVLEKRIENPALVDAIQVAALLPHIPDYWQDADAQELRSLLTRLRPDTTPEAVMEEIQWEFDQIYRYFEQGQTTQMQLTEMLTDATHENAVDTTLLIGQAHQLTIEKITTGEQIQQMTRAQEELETALKTDSLTGASTRDAILTTGAKILREAAPTNGSAVLFLDLDRFKGLNDTHGHAAGDQLLQHFVRRIRSSIRRTDHIGRIGGDEFMVVLADCTQAGATIVAQKIIDSLARSPLTLASNAIVPITTSIGAAWLAPDDVISLEAAMRCADRLMYQAKSAGRNQCCAGRFDAHADAEDRRKAG